jgi:hypothetical protein
VQAVVGAAVRPRGTRIPPDEAAMIDVDLWQPDATVSRYAARQIQEMHAIEPWRTLLPHEALQNPTGRVLGEADIRRAATSPFQSPPVSSKWQHIWRILRVAITGAIPWPVQ